MTGVPRSIRAALDCACLTSQWPAEALAELAAQSELRQYRDGERVAAAGDPIDAVWIVTEGSFIQSRTWQNGRRLLYSYLRAGQSAGVLAVLDRLPAVFDVTARGNGTMVVLGGEVLRALIRKYPVAARETMLYLCRRIRTDYDVIELHAMNSVRCRIAKSLLWIARGNSPSGDGEMTIDTRLSQEDLADIVCAARQSVNRELRRLMKEGIIQQRYRAIIIADRRRLMEIGGEDESFSLGAHMPIDTAFGDLYPAAD